MKKLSYKVLMMALVMLTLTGCKDFLDKTPDTRVYLVNIEQLRQLLITSYMDYNYALVCELSSDNVIDNNSPDADGVRYNLSSYNIADEQVYKWEDVDMDISSGDTPSGIWHSCYNAIASANAVLEKVKEFEQNGIDGVALSSDEQEDLNAIKGEALMIRAYHHFILAQVFCMPYRGAELSKSELGIPYMTWVETEVDPKYDRGTLAETYEKIEKDLLEGLPLINDQIYDVPKYHFNKAAANAFAARFYLFKRDYEKARDYATASFKGNDPATMLNQLWQKTDFYYIRDIGRYFTSVEQSANLMCFTSYSTWWRRLLGYRFACNRDAKRSTIQGPGPTWYNCKYTNSKTKQRFSMMPCFNGYCGTSGGQEYGTYFAGTAFEQFEYTDKISGIGYPHEIRAEFTVEEMLLTRAEANLFLGNKEAVLQDLAAWNSEHILDASRNYNMEELTTLEQITTYYAKEIGYDIKKEFHIDEVCPSNYTLDEDGWLIMQAIQHFRRIQTVHMGNRWFDIKRFGFSITHKFGPTETYTLQVLDPRYAIQIPSEVLSADMEPNPRPVQSTSDATVAPASDNVPTND